MELIPEDPRLFEAGICGERSKTPDGYEWVCVLQTKHSVHFVIRTKNKIQES